MAITHELRHEIEQYLYEEARILDKQDFHKWVEMFTDDVHYWMPTRTNFYRKDSKAIAVLDRSSLERQEEMSNEREVAFFDETKQTLQMRVARLDTGMAWAEDPPSRTRHIFTNIQVEEGDKPDELKVFCNYLLYRNRLGTEQDFYIGAREDVLRKVDGTWKICYRKVILDQNVLLAKNLSNFF